MEDNREQKVGISGLELKELDNNILYDKVTNQYYIKRKNGKIKLLSDPISGGTVSPLDNGEWISDSTGLKYSFDEKRNCLIPKFIPDNSKNINFRKAHMEGDYLVSDDDSSVRYEVDSAGNVLTPEKIEFQKLKQANDEYLKKQYQEKIQSIEESIIEESNEIIRESNETISNIKMAGDETVWHIERGISELDENATLNNSNYLDKTLELYRNKDNFPLLTEFYLKNNKCYYCTYNMSSKTFVQARTFNYNKEFLNEFLEPFIEFSATELGVTNPLCTPNKDNTGYDLSNVSFGEYYITIKNIDYNYATELSKKINSFKGKHTK